MEAKAANILDSTIPWIEEISTTVDYCIKKRNVTSFDVQEGFMLRIVIWTLILMESRRNKCYRIFPWVDNKLARFFWDPLSLSLSTSGIYCYLHSEDQVVDEVLKLPNDETVIGLLETVESEEHKNVLPKDSEMDSINFIVSGEEDVFHEDLITQQRVKSYEICENEKSEAEPILTKDMMFQSVSDVKSFMSKYMNFSKSAFVIASSNQRQVNNITFTL